MLQEALLPSVPSSPNKSKTIILGVLFGLLASCGVVAVQMKLDDKIRSAEEMKKYFNMPTLGTMLLQEGVKQKKKQKQGETKA